MHSSGMHECPSQCPQCTRFGLWPVDAETRGDRGRTRTPTRSDGAAESTGAASGARASKRPRVDQRAAKAHEPDEEKTPCPGVRAVSAEDAGDDEDGELRCAGEGARCLREI